MNSITTSAVRSGAVHRGDRLDRGCRRDVELQRVGDQGDERLQLWGALAHPIDESLRQDRRLTGAETEENTQRIANDSITVARAVRLGVHRDERQFTGVAQRLVHEA